MLRFLTIAFVIGLGIAAIIGVAGCDRNPVDNQIGSKLPQTDSTQQDDLLPGIPPQSYPDAPPIPNERLTPSASANVMGVSGTTIVAQAQTWLSVRYLYGGNSRSGVDCSHLVDQVYSAVGINYPFMSTYTMKTSSHFICVNPVAGDLITFRNLAHVGIYVGNGWMIDANSYYGKVMYDYIYDSYWQAQGPYAIRYIG